MNDFVDRMLLKLPTGSAFMAETIVVLMANPPSPGTGTAAVIAFFNAVKSA